MGINDVRVVSGTRTPDDRPFFVIKRDWVGGVNTRSQANRIVDQESVQIENYTLDTKGQLSKRLGSVLISDDMGAESVVALHNYVRQGYTDQLMMYEDNNLNASESEGNHTEVKADFAASQTDIGIIQLKESGLVPDDVMFINAGGATNWFRIHKASGGAWAEQDLGNTSGTGADSPPRSTVGAWYRNRVWILSNDQLYFSAAYSADYSSAFDTPTNVFRVPVGDERGMYPTRDTGMIIMGEQAIWGLAPSVTPVATDKPEPLITSHGVVSKKGWCSVGDDLFFFAQDGLRSLKRTVQDKLQMGVSYPISYNLKDEFDEIAWGYADRIQMIYHNNKVYISVPIGADTFKVWVYYPVTNTFTILNGWTPRSWATHKISGDLRLYYGQHGDGKVFRGDYGYRDDGTDYTTGTTISTIWESREEDFGQPLIKKIGGEVEIEAAATGSSAAFTVEARKNGGAYTTLGTVTLSSDDAPTLPVDLPFSLTDEYVIREKFHLDGFENYRTIQIKITESNTNNTELKLYGISITAYPEEYESE